MAAIEIENLSKQYTLGTIGSGTLWRDMNVWWAGLRGKPNPYLKIGQTNDRTQKADGDYVWALKDINLKIEEGDVVGIIGSNGAGKSTLLKILSRVTTPTTGRITTYGRIASLLEVGTGFHQEMTGRENIYMNGAIMGMTRAEITSKLDDIVDFAGVAKYIDTPVKRYSSGMTVRLGFAVAAFLEPEILIVDEVLAVGDAEFQKKAIGKMQDVSRGEGRTVLFVSHNMAAVSTLCKKGIVLDNGRIDFVGSASDAIDVYQSKASVEQKDKIVDGIVYQNPTIHIDRICINGSENANQTIGSSQRFIDLSIEGYTEEKFSGNVVMKFRNMTGAPIAIFSEGRYKGEILTFTPGPFSICRRIILPRFLSAGDCHIELNFTQPRCQDYFRAMNCALLHFDGSAMEYGAPGILAQDGLFCLESEQH